MECRHEVCVLVYESSLTGVYLCSDPSDSILTCVYSGCRRDDLRPFDDLAYVGRRLASYGQDDTGVRTLASWQVYMLRVVELCSTYYDYGNHDQIDRLLLHSLKPFE